MWIQKVRKRREKSVFAQFWNNDIFYANVVLQWYHPGLLIFILYHWKSYIYLTPIVRIEGFSISWAFRVGRWCIVTVDKDVSTEEMQCSGSETLAER